SMMVTRLQSTNQVGTFSMGRVMSAPVGCRDIHGWMLARELGDGKEDRAVPRREPRPGIGIPGRLSGVLKSLRGPWVGGMEIHARGCSHATPFIESRQATGPLPLRQPLSMHRARPGRCADARGTLRTPLGRASVPLEPTPERKNADARVPSRRAIPCLGS